MKMKKTMASVLSAALLISGGATAMAVDQTTTPSDPSITIGATASAMLTAKMEVTEVALRSGAYPYLVAKTILPEGSTETVQEIRLNLSEKTACIDGKTGLAANAEAIKKGDVIYATYSSAMTRSIPPQSAAYAVVVNADKVAPRFLVAEAVTKNNDGSVTVLTDEGGLLLTIGKDTPVAPYQTKDNIKNTDIVVGTSFFAWYEVVALSMPGQAQPTKVVVLPTSTEETKTNAPAETKDAPLQPGQTTPYRFGTQATITDVTTEGSVVKSYTLKSEDAKLGSLVALVDANTLVIDNETATRQTAALQKGDSVYVYYGDTLATSEPAQVTAELILTKVSKDSLPARFVSIERSEQNVDGSVRLLGENKSLWVTLGADTPLTTLDGKTVKNTDLHMGASVLVWCNAIQESLPAQTSATKAVLLPQIDRSFTIITGGDIAIAEGKVEDGVAMVPLRKVAEQMGFTVTWNNEERSIHLTDGKLQTTVTIGQDLYFYSSAAEKMIGMSKPSPLGAAPVLTNETTFVPAELFALLGATPTLTDSVMHL